MNQDELKARTKKFGLRVMRLAEVLPHDGSVAGVIGRQLVRSGTSVGANYRAACRAQSSADFVHKLSLVEEEADESHYWMELLIDSGIMKEEQLSGLMNEASEITAIVVASIRTVKQRAKLRKK